MTWAAGVVGVVADLFFGRERAVAGGTGMDAEKRVHHVADYPAHD